MENNIKSEEENQNETNKRNIRKRVGAILIAVVYAVFVFWAGFIVSRLTLDEDIRTIDYILGMYKQFYFDESDDVVSLFADALLDDYSTYYTKEEYEADMFESLVNSGDC